jgi:ribosomal protein S18 acetylase RimI-like enzyme
MTVNIRPATLADLSPIQRLLHETWHATYDALYGAGEVEAISRRWHAIEALAQQLVQPHSVFLVAEQAGAIIATSLAHEIEPGVIKLSRLYVSPANQSQGLGARLMRETLAGFDPANRVRLEVAELNTGAIRFYERHGFVLSRAVEYEGGAVARSLIYERRLGT